MICIINNGTSHLEDIKENVPDHKVITIDEMENFDFKPYSGIVITGAPISLIENGLQKYIDRYSFIKTVDVPVLGICLGHHIVGIVFGAKIWSGKMIDRKEKIFLKNQDKLLEGVQDKSNFREEHSDYISLPEQFTLLASSESCDNEGMRHKNKEIYSVQFHPEVSEEQGKTVLANFLEMCK